MNEPDARSTGAEYAWDAQLDLSPAGQARCREMLAGLRHDVVRVGRRRRHLRNGRHAACLLLLLALAWQFTGRLAPVDTPPGFVDATTPPGKVTVVKTATDVLQRLSVNPEVNLSAYIAADPERVTGNDAARSDTAMERLAVNPAVDLNAYAVDDRGLIRILHNIGRPTGMIIEGSRYVFTDLQVDEIDPPDRRQEPARGKRPGRS